MPKNYVELTLEIKKETDQAILVSDGSVQAWIPKSQLECDPEPSQIDGLFDICIAEWIAEDKELI